MGDKTGIGWTNATWNPLVGCSIKSAGCINCYAQIQAARIIRMNPDTHYVGTIEYRKGKPVWNGVIKPAPEHILMQPLSWKRPRRVFVNSMSDMFHEDCSEEIQDKSFAVMAIAGQHQFQVLTKRAPEMQHYLNHPTTPGRVWARAMEILNKMDAGPAKLHEISNRIVNWPLPNVWVGVSAERQYEFGHRSAYLRDTKAAVRFISAEPLIGAIEMSGLLRGIHWVIVGGESGDDARPIHYSWVHQIIEVCRFEGTKVFVKQLGARPVDDDHGFIRDVHLRHRKGEDMAEWPERFRIQEYPQELTGENPWQLL